MQVPVVQCQAVEEAVRVQDETQAEENFESLCWWAWSYSEAVAEVEGQVEGKGQCQVGEPGDFLQDRRVAARVKQQRTSDERGQKGIVDHCLGRGELWEGGLDGHGSGVEMLPARILVAHFEKLSKYFERFRWIYFFSPPQELGPRFPNSASRQKDKAWASNLLLKCLKVTSFEGRGYIC